MDVMVENW